MWCEKTKLESIHSSFQTKEAIKHWLIWDITKSIYAFLSYILLFHVREHPLTTYPIHLPIAVSSRYSLLLTLTLIRSCGEKLSALHILFPVFFLYNTLKPEDPPDSDWLVGVPGPPNTVQQVVSQSSLLSASRLRNLLRVILHIDFMLSVYSTQHSWAMTKVLFLGFSTLHQE